MGYLFSCLLGSTKDHSPRGPPSKLSSWKRLSPRKSPFPFNEDPFESKGSGMKLRSTDDKDTMAQDLPAAQRDLRGDRARQHQQPRQLRTTFAAVLFSTRTSGRRF